MKIKTVGIIGYGSFGEFLYKIINKYFPKIKIKVSSRTKKINNKKFYSFEDVVASDIVIVTTPIQNIPETIKKISKIIKPDTIVIDISTIKEFPEKELKKYPEIKYICTHPMFGPYSYKKAGEKLDNLRIVLTSYNVDKKIYTQAKKILSNLKLKIIETTAKSHDKKIADTLFLTHLIGQTVSEAGYERTDIDTKSFGFLMDAVESVKQDKKLFHDIHKHNKYCDKTIDKFQKTLSKIKKTL